LSTSIKRRFLELLDKDEEFRLAVVGKLGVTDKLDRLQQTTDRLVEEVRALREGQDRLVGEQQRMNRAIKDIGTTLERLTPESGR